MQATIECCFCEIERKSKLIWEQINRILSIWGTKVKLKGDFFRLWHGRKGGNLNLVINVNSLMEQLSPYEDEPLADVGGDENSDSDDEEADTEGLTQAILEGRFERTVTFDSW